MQESILGNSQAIWPPWSCILHMIIDVLDDVFLLRIIRAKHIQLLKLANHTTSCHGAPHKYLFLMIQKICRSKILGSIWMQDRNKWFGRWDALSLLHDASMDSSMREAILSQSIAAWERFGGSCFTYYITYVAPNYETVFSERWNYTHWYVLQLTDTYLFAIHTFASIWLSSHSLWYELERWGVGE